MLSNMPSNQNRELYDFITVLWPGGSIDTNEVEAFRNNLLKGSFDGHLIYADKSQGGGDGGERDRSWFHDRGKDIFNKLLYNAFCQQDQKDTKHLEKKEFSSIPKDPKTTEILENKDHFFIGSKLKNTRDLGVRKVSSYSKAPRVSLYKTGALNDRNPGGGAVLRQQHALDPIAHVDKPGMVSHPKQPSVKPRVKKHVGKPPYTQTSDLNKSSMMHSTVPSSSIPLKIILADKPGTIESLSTLKKGFFTLQQAFQQNPQLDITELLQNPTFQALFPEGQPVIVSNEAFLRRLLEVPQKELEAFTFVLNQVAAPTTTMHGRTNPSVPSTLKAIEFNPPPVPLNRLITATTIKQQTAIPLKQQTATPIKQQNATPPSLKRVQEMPQPPLVSPELGKVDFVPERIVEHEALELEKEQLELIPAQQPLITTDELVALLCEMSELIDRTLSDEPKVLPEFLLPENVSEHRRIQPKIEFTDIEKKSLFNTKTPIDSKFARKEYPLVSAKIREIKTPSIELLSFDSQLFESMKTQLEEERAAEVERERVAFETERVTVLTTAKTKFKETCNDLLNGKWTEPGKVNIRKTITLVSQVTTLDQLNELQTIFDQAKSNKSLNKASYANALNIFEKNCKL